MSTARRVYPRRTRCWRCGERARPGDPLTRGHIIPAAAGGPDEPWNIAPEHATCNQARGVSYTRADVAYAMARKHAR